MFYLFNHLASLVKNKPSKSTSSGLCLVVRDSHQAIKEHDLSNVSSCMPIIGKAAGAFTGLVFVLTISTFLVAPVSAADSLTVTSSGAQNINISTAGSDPTTGISTAISKDQIIVSTTCRSGYNFAVSASVDDNNLYLNGNSSNNTVGTYFSPVSGSTALNSSANTWGYYYNADDTAPIASSTFSPVPALGGTVATIKSPLPTPSTTDINDEFSLYYGVAMNSSMPLGTYKLIPDINNSNQDGTIVYYTTMADACISYRVSFNPASIFNGTTLSGTGTMQDQVFYEGVSANLNSVGFTPPSGYYFAGWNTKQDGTGTSYTNEQQVTDLAAVGSTITLYAQWTDCPGNYICYSSNGATGPVVSGNIAAMSNQSVYSTATAVGYLHAPNFYRTDYGFLGWSTMQLDPDDANFTTNFANATAAGKVYGPNERLTITAGQYSTGGLRLYAVWLPKSTTYTMQTFGETECTNNLTKITYKTDTNSNSGVSFATENHPSITLDSFIALQDTRDTNIYTVARLTDGNCWMTDNLRLEYTNSDNSTGNLAQGYHTDATYGNFKGLAEPETANFTGSTSSATNPTEPNSLYYAGTQSGTATIDISQTSHAGFRMPRYNNFNTQSTVASSTGDNNTYGYGNYYTWAAAMANTTYYSGPTATDSNSKTSETVNTSICPKGWRLPYGRSTGNGIASKGFSNLSASMDGSNADMNSSSTPTGAVTSNRLRQFPNNFLYSGRFFRSSAYLRGSSGGYWSSTAYDDNYSYKLDLSSTVVSPGTSGDSKYGGNSIRCVAGS